MSRAATRHDLSLCRQERNEPIWPYLKRFFDIRATIPNISDENVIDCFHNGISTQSLYHDFGHNRPTTVIQLREMMQKWANQEEQECNGFPRRDFDHNGRRNNDRDNDKGQWDPNRKGKLDDLVEVVERLPRSKKMDNFDKILHNKSLMHPKGNHSLFDYYMLRKSLNAPPPKNTGKKKDREDDEDEKEDP